jgi:hypothetical protein
MTKCETRKQLSYRNVTVVPLVEMVELLIGFVGFCGLSLLNGIVITFIR